MLETKDLDEWLGGPSVRSLASTWCLEFSLADWEADSLQVGGEIKEMTLFKTFQSWSSFNLGRIQSGCSRKHPLQYRLSYRFIDRLLHRYIHHLANRFPPFSPFQSQQASSIRFKPSTTLFHDITKHSLPYEMDDMMTHFQIRDENYNARDEHGCQTKRSAYSEEPRHHQATPWTRQVVITCKHTLLTLTHIHLT